MISSTPSISFAYRILRKPVADNASRILVFLVPDDLSFFLAFFTWSAVDSLLNVFKKVLITQMDISRLNCKNIIRITLILSEIGNYFLHGIVEHMSFLKNLSWAFNDELWFLLQMKIVLKLCQIEHFKCIYIVFHSKFDYFRALFTFCTAWIEGIKLRRQILLRSPAKKISENVENCEYQSKADCKLLVATSEKHCLTVSENIQKRISSWQALPTK